MGLILMLCTLLVYNGLFAKKVESKTLAASNASL